MGLMVAYDPDDQSEEEDRARLLLVNGTNLGPKKKSLRWRVEVVSVETQQGVDEVPRIRWDGESGVTADEIAMLNSGDRGPGALVKANLRAILRQGPVTHSEVWGALEAECSASERTRWRVIGQEVDGGRILKAREKRDNGRVWYALPTHEVDLVALTEGAG